jgi:hypothetical protein
MNICIQNAYRAPTFGEGCRQVDGESTFADSAFAAYDGDFMFDFAHFGVEFFYLFSLLKQSLCAGVNWVLGFFYRAHKNNQG